MASWAPPNKVNPSVTTSSLRLSRALKAARSMSPNVGGHASCRPAQQPPPEGTLSDPPHPPQRTLLGGGPRQVRRFKGRDRCNLLHMRRRSGWASILVTLDMGNAVKGADAEGPCWDRSKARWGSSLPGRTSSWMNLCSVCLVAVCCQPTLADWVRDQRPTQVEILTTQSKWVSRGQRPPTAADKSSLRGNWPNQWAATRTRWALLKPNPPGESAKLDNTCAGAGALGVPRMVRKLVPHVGIVTIGKLCCLPNTPQQKFAPGCSTHQQEEPSCLWVIHPWNPLNSTVCSRLLFSKNLKQTLADRWECPTPSTLVGKLQVCISLPHNGARL